jgi:enoyl-CoA hydratase/carnithine racemase
MKTQDLLDITISGVVEAAQANDPNTPEYFSSEYRLNHLIACLDTPYISIMDGITSMFLQKSAT